MKHTPGPWSIFEGSDKWNTFQIDGPNRGPGGTNASAVVHWAGFDSGDRPPKEKRANGHLICAAPELLETLRNMLSDVEAWKDNPHGHAPTHYIADARAAIAKALGK